MIDHSVRNKQTKGVQRTAKTIPAEQ
jgi:hypothetical protein